MLFQYESQNPYQVNQDCKMNIVCPNGKYVAVDLQDIDIQRNYRDGLCNTDYLLIDGSKKCGSTPPVISTSNNEMEINFHSDGADTGDGFKLSFGCKG